MVATDRIWSEAAMVATDGIWSEGMPPRAPRSPRVFLAGAAGVAMIVDDRSTLSPPTGRQRIDGHVDAATIVEVGANE